MFAFANVFVSESYAVRVSRLLRVRVSIRRPNMPDRVRTQSGRTRPNRARTRPKAPKRIRTCTPTQ
eukprot:2046047-Alexandrium_andersonii.AAC.1